MKHIHQWNEFLNEFHSVIDMKLDRVPYYISKGVAFHLKS